MNYSKMKKLDLIGMVFGMQHERQQLNKEIVSICGKIQDKNIEISTLDAKLEEIEKENINLRSQLDARKADIRDLEKLLNNAKKDNSLLVDTMATINGLRYLLLEKGAK